MNDKLLTRLFLVAARENEGVTASIWPKRITAPLVRKGIVRHGFRTSIRKNQYGQPTRVLTYVLTDKGRQHLTDLILEANGMAEGGRA